MKGSIYEQVEKTIKRNLTFKRGDIILANLDGIGSEQRGVRPVLIIQNDNHNMTSNTLIVICLTSKEKRMDMKCHVKLFDGSIALCEQIRTIDKSRAIKKICSLNRYQIQEVEAAIRNSMRL